MTSSRSLPNVDPPVCKIMDYGKFRFEETKKEHERKKKQATVILKEVKLRPKTEEHDLDHKVKQIRRFISESCKVKVTIMFRGREITHPELANALMNKLKEMIIEYVEIEQHPKLEGRNMTMVLAPK